ncbi:unnamed protein product [Triticum turgidum subsp. durum]|uniref:Uncharacterized protein n=1 Tax=Triticum turgidum subsp. durum TaxID=4567 RepID=A0A9R0PZH5_TRITD|nr:unnamed protein product [Triticum turgidum subsp. durum]
MGPSTSSAIDADLTHVSSQDPASSEVRMRAGRGSALGSSRATPWAGRGPHQAECLTPAVRKQSKGVGSYLVSTRWHKNFWLLA